MYGLVNFIKEIKDIYVLIHLMMVNMFLLCVHPFRAPILIFVASYSTVIGIVVYCIMALSSPYQGLSKVSLKPLEAIYNYIVSTPEFEKILKDTGFFSENVFMM